jgi:hypothetical protein
MPAPHLGVVPAADASLCRLKHVASTRHHARCTRHLRNEVIRIRYPAGGSSESSCDSQTQLVYRVPVYCLLLVVSADQVAALYNSAHTCWCSRHFCHVRETS